MDSPSGMYFKEKIGECGVVPKLGSDEWFMSRITTLRECPVCLVPETLER